MKEYKEYILFIGIGLTAFMTHLSVAWILYYKAGLHILVSNAFAFSTAFTISLLGHSKYTFRSQKPIKVVLIPFASGALFSLAINEYFLYFFSLHVSDSVMFNLSVATMISSLFFYAFNKFFVFQS